MDDDFSLCYYDVLHKQLNGSLISKARRFNREKCVIQKSTNIYEVLPIKGYNKTMYTVDWDAWDPTTSTCDCQHYTKYQIADCTHITAVALHIKNGSTHLTVETKDYTTE